MIDLEKKLPTLVFALACTTSVYSNDVNISFTSEPCRNVTKSIDFPAIDNRSLGVVKISDIDKLAGAHAPLYTEKEGMGSLHTYSKCYVNKRWSLLVHSTVFTPPHEAIVTDYALIHNTYIKQQNSAFSSSISKLDCARVTTELDKLVRFPTAVRESPLPSADATYIYMCAESDKWPMFNPPYMTEDVVSDYPEETPKFSVPAFGYQLHIRGSKLIAVVASLPNDPGRCPLFDQRCIHELATEMSSVFPYRELKRKPKQ